MRIERFTLGVWMLSVSLLMAGCSAGGQTNINVNANCNADENENCNEDVFSVEAWAAMIVADIERARDCGDAVTPLLTEDQVIESLNEGYLLSGGEPTFEVYVQQQVQVFKDNADLLCALSGGGNANSN